MHKKISTTVYLDPEQVTMLKALSVKTGVPTAAYIRRAIDHFINEHVRGDLLTEAEVERTVSIAPIGDRDSGQRVNLEYMIEGVVRRVLTERTSG